MYDDGWLKITEDSQWNSVEVKPKDSKRVLVILENAHVCIAEWHEYVQDWRHDNVREYQKEIDPANHVVGWMNLPDEDGMK